MEGVGKEYPRGITFEAVAQEFQERYGGLIALASLNGKIKELYKRPDRSGELAFYTLDSDIGHKTYVRSVTLLLMKAIQDIVGVESTAAVKVEFAIGSGYFIRCGGNLTPDEGTVSAIRNRMRELVKESLPILKKSYPLEEAVELFRRHGMKDKEQLLRYRRSSVVNVYEIDGYHDYYYGYMLPNTSYLKYFDLVPYEYGMMLMVPAAENPTFVEAPETREKLFRTLEQSTNWGVQMGVDTVGDLNDQICQGKLNEMILVQEALMESRIGEIAAEIANKKGTKFVMIAGPSSSGKTTFSHRLSIQLRTHGLNPHPIAVDDYFVNRDQTPKDESGAYNFECLEAIDVEQFNKDMLQLLSGREVELPSFNFKTGLREYKGNYKKLGTGDVLVIEGIHALNDKMSYELPSESKFKIYISALTTLNIDEHNRIPTTDGRLLRRMVRDARTRGASAQRTIQMWASVRRGEEENIFPYQESADAMFNSTLIYELAVLKQFAEPLLFGIGKDEPEYYEAKRLLKFLEYFLGVSSEDLPKNSILREFVSGSCFHV